MKFEICREKDLFRSFESKLGWDGQNRKSSYSQHMYRLGTEQELAGSCSSLSSHYHKVDLFIPDLEFELFTEKVKGCHRLEAVILIRMHILDLSYDLLQLIDAVLLMIIYHAASVGMIDHIFVVKDGRSKGVHEVKPAFFFRKELNGIFNGIKGIG